MRLLSLERSYNDSAKGGCTFSLGAIGKLEVSHIIPGNGTTGVFSLHDVQSGIRGDIGGISLGGFNLRY